MPNADDIDLPLGITDDGALVRNPYPNLSRLVLGGTSAGKTTSCVMPTAQALFGHPGISVIVADVKDGECYAQLRGIANETKRNFGCIDDFGLFGAGNPDRIRLNPFGSILSAIEHAPETLNFTIEASTHAFIEEVEDGKRNFVFRERPRSEIHLAIRAISELKPNLLTPGLVFDLMSDPRSWRSMREVAAEEGSPALKARAQSSLDVEERNPEDYHRHHAAALSALSPYETGSVLNIAGADADLTHEDVCNGGWVLCHALPQVHAQRVGVHLALHHQSVMAAQFSGRGGTVRAIYDELCNSPARKAIEAVTIQRSKRLACDYIAQTFEDIERQHGKQLAAVLADNCPVHQYLSFSYADAERVSKRWGDEISIQRSVNINASRLEVSGSMSLGKQPVMTPDQLMTLDPAYQVIFIRGVGHFVCRKLFQNQIEPTCHLLSPNPQEGGALPPDPKVELPFDYGAKS